MSTLKVDGSRVSLLLPRAGNSVGVVVVLGIMMLLGAGFLVAVILLAVGFFGDPALLTEDGFPLLPFLSLFASVFFLIPFLGLVGNRKKKAERLEPYAFVFDNAAGRMEIMEDADTTSPWTWVPYSAIAGFALDTYTTSTKNSTTTWYVAAMLKRDGAVWDLDVSTDRRKIEAFLDEVRDLVDLEEADERADAAEEGPPVFDWPADSGLHRDPGPEGLMYRWHNEAGVAGAVIFLFVAAIMTWMIGSTLLGVDQEDGVWIIGAFVGLFDLVALLVLGLSVKGLFTDQAIRVGNQGLEIGRVFPRNGGTFKAKRSLGYDTVKAVAYSWNRRNGGTGRELLFLGQRALDLSTHHKTPTNLAELGSQFQDMMALWKDSERIPISGLPLSSILLLEAGLEAEIRRRGGSAI